MAMLLIRRSALLLRRPAVPASRSSQPEVTPSLAATSSAAAGAAARSSPIRSKGYRMFSDGSATGTGTQEVGGHEPMLVTKICRGLVQKFSALHFTEKVTTVSTLCTAVLFAVTSYDISAQLDKLRQQKQQEHAAAAA